MATSKIEGHVDSEIRFACTNLPDLDTLSRTDPFLKLFNYENDKWTQVWESKVIYNMLDPEFPDFFCVQYRFETMQIYRIEVYHFEKDNNSKYIGEAEFKLSEVVQDDVLVKDLIDNKNGKYKGS